MDALENSLRKLQFCNQTVPLIIHVYAQDEVSSLRSNKKILEHLIYF